MRTKQRAVAVFVLFFRSPPPTPSPTLNPRSHPRPSPSISIPPRTGAHTHARTLPPLNLPSLSLSLSPSLPLSQNGKAVVEVNGTKVLLALDGEDVRAVSNKCTHLGLSLQGKVRVQRSCARGRAG